jgi:hypothetical protein
LFQNPVLRGRRCHHGSRFYLVVEKKKAHQQFQIQGVVRAPDKTDEFYLSPEHRAERGLFIFS